MKINLTLPLKGLDGKDIKDSQNPKELVMMNVVIANILTNRKSPDPLADFILAKKIYSANGEIDLTSKEISRLDGALTAAQIPALSEGQIREVIDGCPTPEK